MFGSRTTRGTVPGEAFELWGQRGWAGADISGESFHSSEIKKVLGADFRADGAEADRRAFLLPDPTNPHGKTAVRVVIDGHHVGYLPSEVSGGYFPVLSELVERGLAPCVMARVWARQETDWVIDHSGHTKEVPKEIIASVRLDLAEPHMIAPMNVPPATPFKPLPSGPAVQISGEDTHMAALKPYLRPEGQGWIYTSLRIVEESVGRTTRQLIAVDIDGHEAGRMTPKMSGEFIPAVALFDGSAAVCLARALVKGNELKADVAVYAARSGGLDEEWIRDAKAIAAATSVSSTGGSSAAPSPYVSYQPDALTAPSASPAPPPMAPAAWYPNPSGSGLRWWDGAAWTEYTHAQ